MNPGNLHMFIEGRCLVTPYLLQVYARWPAGWDGSCPAKWWLSSQNLSSSLPGTLKLTASSHLKMDGWKIIFVLGWPIFKRYVSFREGKFFVRVWNALEWNLWEKQSRKRIQKHDFVSNFTCVCFFPPPSQKSMFDFFFFLGGGDFSKFPNKDFPNIIPSSLWSHFMIKQGWNGETSSLVSRLTRWFILPGKKGKFRLESQKVFFKQLQREKIHHPCEPETEGHERCWEFGQKLESSRCDLVVSSGINSILPDSMKNEEREWNMKQQRVIYDSWRVFYCISFICLTIKRARMWIYFNHGWRNIDNSWTLGKFTIGWGSRVGIVAVYDCW